MNLLDEVKRVFDLPAETAQDRLDAGDRVVDNLRAMRRANLAYRRAKDAADRVFELAVKATTPIDRERAKRRYETAHEEELRRKSEWLTACESAACDLATERGYDVFSDGDETLEADLAASLQLGAAE